MGHVNPGIEAYFGKSESVWSWVPEGRWKLLANSPNDDLFESHTASSQLDHSQTQHIPLI